MSEPNSVVVAQSGGCTAIKTLLPKQGGLSYQYPFSLPCHPYPSPPVPQRASKNPPGLPQKISQAGTQLFYEQQEISEGAQ